MKERLYVLHSFKKFLTSFVRLLHTPVLVEHHEDVVDWVKRIVDRILELNQ